MKTLIKSFLTSIAAFALLSVVFIGCMKPRLYDCIQKDLCNNPKLKQRNISLWIVNEKDGYVTVRVANGSFPEQTMAAIRRGQNLNEIRMFVDGSVDALIEMEEILKRRPGVKAVDWTAEQPGSSTSGVFGCDHYDSACKE